MPDPLNRRYATSMEFTHLSRMMIFSPLLWLLVGCGADGGAIEGVAVDPRNEPRERSATEQRLPETESTEPTFPALAEADAIPVEAEMVIWQWLDANIGSQERLAASRTGQRLSGSDVGEEIQLTSTQSLLFTEQLNLLHAIRQSRNTTIARQYLLVHTLMTIHQAEHTQSVLPANDPRLVGVLQQIITARQLLAAIGYEMHLAPEETVDPSAK